jgi:argininosuccinate lyase
MRRAAGAGWVTLTELADTLVREHGVAFGHAHQMAGRLVLAREADADATLADLLARESAAVLGRPIRIDDDTLADILSPERFVAVRRTEGGPAPERVEEALAASREALVQDDAELARRRAALVEADGRRQDACRML